MILDDLFKDLDQELYGKELKDMTEEELFEHVRNVRVRRSSILKDRQPKARKKKAKADAETKKTIKSVEAADLSSLSADQLAALAALLGETNVPNENN